MKPTLVSLGIKNVDIDSITNTISLQVQNSAGDILKSVLGIVQGLASGIFQTLLVIIVSVSLLSTDTGRYHRQIRETCRRTART